MYFYSVGHIIQDIKRVNSLLPEVHFYHVKRQENNVAHELARRDLLALFLLGWEFFPPDLYDVYNSDLRFSPLGIHTHTHIYIYIYIDYHE